VSLGGTIRPGSWHAAWPVPFICGLMCAMACLAPAGGAQGAQPPQTLLMPGASTWLDIKDVNGAAAALNQPLEFPMAVRTESAQGQQEQVPQTCQALLALEGYITGTVSEPDWADLRLMLARCHALRAISQAKPASQSALPATLLALRATQLWPVNAWPAISPDEQEALKRPGLTLRNASGRTQWHAMTERKGSKRADRPVTLQLNADALTLIVQWIAQGDFDGDGNEDWLLLWRAKATGGSWQDTRAALLTRTNKNKALKLHWLDTPSH